MTITEANPPHKSIPGRVYCRLCPKLVFQCQTIIISVIIMLIISMLCFFEYAFIDHIIRRRLSYSLLMSIKGSADVTQKFQEKNVEVLLPYENVFHEFFIHAKL